MMFEKLKSYWDSKTEKQKQAVRGVVIVTIVLSVIGGMLSARKNSKIILYEEEETIFEVEDNDNVKDSWLYSSEKKLSTTAKDVAKLRKENAQLKDDIARIEQEFAAAKKEILLQYEESVTEEVSVLREEIADLLKKQQEKQIGRAHV